MSNDPITDQLRVLGNAVSALNNWKEVAERQFGDFRAINGVVAQRLDAIEQRWPPGAQAGGAGAGVGVAQGDASTPWTASANAGWPTKPVWWY